MGDRYAKIREALELGPTPGPWLVDSSIVEHGCCWDGAIAAMVAEGDGQYGGSVKLIAECDAPDAAYIAACDPDTISALLEQVETIAALEAENERLREKRHSDMRKAYEAGYNTRKAGAGLREGWSVFAPTALR